MDYIDLLTNPGEAGVFATPRDVRALDDALDRAGFERWRVDLQGVSGKPELMRVFQRALGFADTFGANWDALHDALSERALDEPAGVALTLAHCGDVARAQGGHFERLVEVLDAVAENCYDEDIPFWVFIDGVAAADFDLPRLDEK
ncbi:MAG TPA: barstar family protein [Burkholderiales bacterium]|nr:barstar family protein [Burkholderiales bacterium]